MAMLKLLRTMGVNTQYNCYRCLIPGRHNANNRGSYPGGYLDGTAYTLPRRTDLSLRSDAQAVTDNRTENRSCGVNGISVIATMFQSSIFDMVSQNLFDLFHTVFENIAPKLVGIIKMEYTAGNRPHFGLTKKQRDQVELRWRSLILCRGIGKKPPNITKKRKLKGIMQCSQ